MATDKKCSITNENGWFPKSWIYCLQHIWFSMSRITFHWSVCTNFLEHPMSSPFSDWLNTTVNHTHTRSVHLLFLTLSSLALCLRNTEGPRFTTSLTYAKIKLRRVVGTEYWRKSCACLLTLTLPAIMILLCSLNMTYMCICLTASILKITVI